ncbi:alpha/beta hydrolase [Acinetobacter sp. MD2(2019)]|uniref:alpha/beta hydrolase n=1 Tax=Acinetobacter sp. MD2(2019) TaxID=2605273 RepID=UPI002D1F3574|nr:alpha/beta fold hydrolase [Acinetobacter sp. MD2(2019)]MEB3753873.1 alpha/beta fold hydrolase [Acinetobacter sp. MD2(2019)]
MTYQIQQIDFESEGETLAADFYMPNQIEQPPVIIMANGFACERRFSLPNVAAEFAEQGFAVVLFDYRGFAESTGEPRELVSPSHHLQDWSNVVRQVQQWNSVDLTQLFLWGVSFSGGHVMTIASQMNGIRGIIALVPHVDGLASAMKYPKKYFFSALKLALKDVLNMTLGRPPVRIPVVSEQGVACLAGEENYAAFMATVPKNSSWLGQVPARIMLDINRYRPICIADKIKCPVLLIAAKNDSLIPFQSIQKTTQKIPQVQFESFDMTHFDIVNKDSCFFQQGMQLQIQFLKQYVSS